LEPEDSGGAIMAACEHTYDEEENLVTKVSPYTRATPGGWHRP